MAGRTTSRTAKRSTRSRADASRRSTIARRGSAIIGAEAPLVIEKEGADFRGNKNVERWRLCQNSSYWLPCDEMMITIIKKLNGFLKRAFDIAASLWALVILSPIMFMVAIIVKLGSPGPVFYLAERTGRHGIPFKIIKFRTMLAEADMMGGGSTTALNDPRFTSTGRFLGKYKLNELPQFVNVLKGEMSVVGPRPQMEEYTKLYNEEEQIILSVRPGITDYASVKFVDLEKTLGDENVDEKYFLEIEPEKNRLRIKYASKNTIFIDAYIIFKTVIALLAVVINGISEITGLRKKCLVSS